MRVRLDWDSRFEELKKYKQQNGTCDVVQTEKGLGHWVHSQRKSMRKGKLCPERVEKLNSIGFRFTVRRLHVKRCKPRSDVVTYNDAKFDQRLEQFKQFRKRFGTGWVPSVFEEDQSFAIFARKSFHRGGCYGFDVLIRALLRNL